MNDTQRRNLQALLALNKAIETRIRVMAEAMTNTHMAVQEAKNYAEVVDLPANDIPSAALVRTMNKLIIAVQNASNASGDVIMAIQRFIDFNASHS